MMGDHSRFLVRPFGKTISDDFGDPLVQLLPAALQKRGVGGVLDERVLEDVGRLRRRAAAVDQLGRHELAECVLQWGTLDGRNRFEQAIRELAPDRRADLRGLLDRREAIQARHQGILQRRREWRAGVSAAARA